DGMEAMYRVCFIDRDETTPPWSFWLEYWAKATTAPELRKYHSEQFARMRAGLSTRVSIAMENGQVRDDIDPVLVSELFLTLVYGLAVQVTLDHETVSMERAYTIAEFVLSLLRAPD